MSAADPSQLRILKELGRSDVLFSVARRPQSSLLYVGSSDARIYELDPMAEKPDAQQFTGHESYVTGLAWTDRSLVSGAYDGRLIWWDVEQRTAMRSVEAHQKWIRGITTTPDRRKVVSVADDMVCRVWDAENGQLLHELRGHQPKTPHHFPSMLFCAAVSPDGELLATGDKVGHVVVWELATGKPLTSVEAPVMYTWDPKQRIHSIGGVRSLAFSPDCRLLALGGIGTIGNIDHLGALARVEIFDWRAGERTHEFNGDTYKGLVEQLHFERDGKWLLASGGDHGGFIKFFDVESSKIIKQDKAPMHIHDLVLNEAEDTIFAAGHGKIVIWHMPVQ